MDKIKMEPVFRGYAFDAMDYVMQAIKTEMCNKDTYSGSRMKNLLNIFRELTILSDEDEVTVYESEYGFLVLG